MEPLLNQDEIQELLKQPATGKQVGHFWDGDTAAFSFFQKANKSQDKLARLDQRHTEAVVTIAQSLSKLIGEPVEMGFEAHQLVSAEEILVGTSTADSVVAELVVGRNQGLVAIPRTMFFLLYNAMLGGAQAFVRTEPLTELERRFFRHLLDPLFTVFSERWGMTVQQRDIVDDQKALTDRGWTFDAIAGKFTVQCRNEKATLTLLFPREVMETAAEETTEGETKRAGGTSDPLWQGAVIDAISDVPLPAQVQLGRVSLPLRNVLNLTPGETYPLVLDNAHVVSVRGFPRFLATTGKMGSQRAIQIVERV